LGERQGRTRGTQRKLGGKKRADYRKGEIVRLKARKRGASYESVSARMREERITGGSGGAVLNGVGGGKGENICGKRGVRVAWLSFKGGVAEDQ